MKSRTRLNTFFPFILILALLWGLAACSPAATPHPVAESVVIEEIVETAGEQVIVTQVVEVEREAMMEATQAPAAESGGLSDEPGSFDQLNFTSPARMVIKDAEMELLVRDTDQALANVTQMASDFGGYLISSQTWYDGDFKYATLRLAVPSASFETALNTLRILGIQVLRETASGQDVSAEYVDLQTRLTNLEATAARVRAFLEEAKTVEESLRVSAQLSELEGQIEQIKGQMRYYEGRTAFSTVTVFLTPERPTPTPTLTPTLTPTPTATPSWNPGATFQEASGTLVTISQGTADLLIWAGVVLGPFALLFVALAWGWRTARRTGSRKAVSPPQTPGD